MFAFYFCRRSTLRLIVLIAMAASAIAISSLQAQAPSPAGQDLDEIMGQMNRAFRTIRTQVQDKSKNASTLDAITAMQSATINAKSKTPSTVAKLPDAQRPTKLAEYRKMMTTLLRAEIDLEENLLADDNAKAATVVTKMEDIQKQGHAAFRPPEP